MLPRRYKIPSLKFKAKFCSAMKFQNFVVQNLCRIYAEFLLPCAASLRYFERGLLSFSATTAIATFASCVMLRLADLI